MTGDNYALAERISRVLHAHQPYRGMQPVGGQTCQCGYWTGVEIPAVNRPVGNVGLCWHQAQIIAEELERDAE